VGEGSVVILIVDDLAAQRLALASALAELGEDVITVGSGMDALRLLLDQDVAVILLDVNMPDMDGFETAALIRQRPRNRHTPIIFLTGDSDEMLLPRAYALGAVDFILNPFVPDILRAKVSVFVELAKLHARVRREAEQRIALSQAQAARALAEEESRRLRFLAEVGAILVGGSLDGPTMARDLLELFVPRVADLAAVTLLDWGGQVSWRGVDAAGALSNAAPPDGVLPAVDAAIQRAMAEGQPVMLGVGPASLRGVVVPLVARGRTAGALAAAMTGSTRDYADLDRELMRIVANRAALAFDNSRLYREIRERDRQKDEFLAMLSHELRNPLGAITAASHLLEAVPLPDGRAVRARGVLLRQSSHLAHIVDDLLDVAQVSAGRVTLDRAAVDLRDLVEQVIDVQRLSGRLDAHQLTTRLDPVLVEVDAVRMTQVVTNILGNAVKYTDSGGRIDVDLRADETQAILCIRDTGIGMSADMIQRLFQPFSQEYQPLDRARGGLGLGLSLVRRLAELHGGAVEAHSEGLGRGSAFTVRLPRLTGAVHPRGEARELTGATPLRILIVEDNADAREMLRTLLELAGHEVHEAGDGLEGLRLAREILPQIALIDLGLPRLDGLEMASRLRAAPEGQHMVLVALTGYGQPRDRQETHDAGFDFHLVKPVGSDMLGDMLALVAARFTARGAVS
jgi:signal transduction histidine kinase